jgi:formiminotetrahydrofolate cyclodeaminase
VGVPERDFLSQRLGDLLEQVAERTPAPGGGSASAVAVALAAGLAGMAASFSDRHWPDAGPAAARAAQLRERAAALAPEDAEAYEAVLAARGEDVPAALERAAAVPLELAELAAEAARLAADASRHGNPNLRGDATAGALLAAAGARAAANLVAINLEGRPEDDRPARAARFAAEAAEAADRALTSS